MSTIRPDLGGTGGDTRDFKSPFPSDAVPLLTLPTR